MAKIKKIAAVFLVVLYGSYYASTNFFIHTHQGAYGAVTHSHPYTSGTHTHSTDALLLIANLTTLLFVSGGMLFGIVVLSASKVYFSSKENSVTTSLCLCGNPLRAPPVLR
jgi:hypothetical protein